MLTQDKYYLSLAEKGERDDGRKPDQFRDIKIETGIVEKAEGSALVKLGRTQILVGIKMDVKEPFPDKLNEGVLMVGAEFSPVASPEFETGPPSVEAVELARVVDRGIRESKAIDVKKLCIKEGEEVWSVSVDIHVLDHDGNLLDASSLAAVAALLDSKMPKYEDGKAIWTERKGKLPLTCKPIAVTHIKVGDKLFVDPLIQEERIATSKLTVATRDDGNINALQKMGSTGMTTSEIEEIIEKAIKHGKELRKKL